MDPDRMNYSNPDPQSCRRCPLHGVKCESKGNELTTLWLEEGWYRPAFKSKKVYRCESVDACIGGNGTGGPDDTVPNYWFV